MDEWKVLLVDDEEDIHALTSIILKDIKFKNKRIKLLSAYSAKQAKELLIKEKDVSLSIIDIVMENENSGLELVKFIRETLNNQIMRIVIRTGQPGYAPPRDIILKYNINDYREKSELSSNGLFTMVIARLREYSEIKKLYSQKNLLEKFDTIDSSKIVSINDLKRILEDTLNTSVVITKAETDKDIKNKIYWKDNNKILFKINKRSYTINFSNNMDNRDLFTIAFEKLILDLENNILYKERINSLYQLIYILSEITETRSLETGEHVKRVSTITKLISEKIFDNKEHIETVSLASMLHDIGKIAIPDKILNKPNKLSDEEWKIMKTHTEIGYKILNSVENSLFKIAANIALYHHENWDGSGYPKGLKNSEIPIESQIVSIADVYDALSNDRIYRKAWPKEKVFKYIKENSGKKFNPKLVKIFFDLSDKIKEL
ncbi:phosphohydrolase [Thermosipho sp. 1063]|uniref:HD domain-containing phosphohydrolase n=1 Tax=unclassified Thermosipho (in: thermotogales) TaxID=2676525 RepID=UPI0009493D8B|nr:MULTISPECIES: HD domain-containing phosphohydrolase [unclassified Thermosipho (in: thermotogales)]ANQ53972.1 phosphohydrolase [Thermosipho sp. 1070]APT72417.1 phosphohydrolase [Thermosipho sp. 1063]OOC43658.1 phosphohydrolase [Thermosipho sp. 1074]